MRGKPITDKSKHQCQFTFPSVCDHIVIKDNMAINRWVSEVKTSKCHWEWKKISSAKSILNNGFAILVSDRNLDFFILLKMNLCYTDSLLCHFKNSELPYNCKYASY